MDFGFLDNYVTYLLFGCFFIYLFVGCFVFLCVFLWFLWGGGGITRNNVDCLMKYFGISRSSNGFCHCTEILKYGAPKRGDNIFDLNDTEKYQPNEINHGLMYIY